MSILLSDVLGTLSPPRFALLLLTVLLAGAVDSVAGGGGLISLPGYLVAGLPIHMSYGTNKVSNLFGTVISAVLYAKSGKTSLRAAALGIPTALVGARAGAQTALLLPPETLTLIMMLMLPPLALFMLFGARKQQGGAAKELSRLRYGLTTALIGLFCGFYDGFFGPGSGTFLILCFTSLLGLDFVTAVGTAKLIILTANLGALTAFAASGQIAYSLVFPCALCSVAGNFIGTRLAIKQGAPLIRVVMSVVLLLLMAKLVTDFIRY